MSLIMRYLFLLLSLGLFPQSCAERHDTRFPTAPLPSSAAEPPSPAPDSASTENLEPIEPAPPGDAGRLTLLTRYDSIRSYPGGGGVFTIAIVPDQDFTGRAILSIDADPALHARLDRSTLNRGRSVAELKLRPSLDIAAGLYTISLQVMHNGMRYTHSLHVRVFEWSQAVPGVEMEKRAAFLSWLATAHPELGDISARPFTRYITYPEILIVEHWTFLGSAWDMRLCFHVMIPPDDWSMMLLRRTGSLTPLLAARRESDGSIHEIPIAEYPLLCGY